MLSDTAAGFIRSNLTDQLNFFAKAAQYNRFIECIPAKRHSDLIHIPFSLCKGIRIKGSGENIDHRRAYYSYIIHDYFCPLPVFNMTNGYCSHPVESSHRSGKCTNESLYLYAI